MLPRAPLHNPDVLFRLHGFPFAVSSEQGFAMGKGAVWCEQASLPGADMTGPVNAVSFEPSPDSIRPDFNIRRNIEQPVYEIHGSPPSSCVLGLFLSVCVQENARIGNTVNPNGEAA